MEIADFTAQQPGLTAPPHLGVSHAALLQQLLQTRPENTGRVTHSSVSRSSKKLKNTDWVLIFKLRFCRHCMASQAASENKRPDLLALSLTREQDLHEIKLNSREMDSFSADSRSLSKL